MTTQKPRYLFSRQGNSREKLARRLRSAEMLALFLDYDGTLTPIRRKPSDAVLSSEAEVVLRSLARLRQVNLNIVTGRSMEDIRRLIPLENVGFVANHGFHIISRGSEWVHPEAALSIQSLHRLQVILQTYLEPFPEALVENKQLTLSVHVRNVVRSKVASLKEGITRKILACDPRLVITRGKEVLEVRPPIEWGKGKSILRILSNFKGRRRVLPVFVGDDNTDEDGFRAIRHRGLTVKVGRARTTKAEYRVKNTAEVLTLLRLIASLRTQRSE